VPPPCVSRHRVPASLTIARGQGAQRKRAAVHEPNAAHRPIPRPVSPSWCSIHDVPLPGSWLPCVSPDNSCHTCFRRAALVPTFPTPAPDSPTHTPWCILLMPWDGRKCSKWSLSRLPLSLTMSDAPSMVDLRPVDTSPPRLLPPMLPSALPMSPMPRSSRKAMGMGPSELGLRLD
jgi:hypothetical protein